MKLDPPRDPGVEHALPGWVSYGSSVTAYLQDGVIRSLLVEKRGLDAREEKEIIESVSLRFGPPVSVRADGYGEKYGRKDVIWRSPLGSVSYRCLQRDECGVEFRSLQLTQEIDAARSRNIERESRRPRAP
jgi:hypothetical protein